MRDQQYDELSTWHQTSYGSSKLPIGVVWVAEREGFLLNLVRREVGNVLQLSDYSDLDVNQHLLDLGIDSLMAIDLLNQLNAQVGVSLSSNMVFEHPTVRGITTVLLRQFFYFNPCMTQMVP